MSLISSALATIKKGSSALDKNEVEKGIVKSYKKESAKKFVGGGSNTEVGIKIVSRNIKKSKVGKGVGYSNIVNQLNGILATTDGIKNTLLTDYANEVKKNRAEKRISNAEKRRKREDNLESKSNKKGKGFSVPGFISKPASSIFDWILNFFGMTILGSLVNLGLDNFDNIAKFFKDITGSGSGGGSGGGGGTNNSAHAETGGSGNTPPLSPPQGNPGGAGGIYISPGGGGGGGGAGGAGNPGPGGNSNGGVGAQAPTNFRSPTNPYGTPGPNPGGFYFAGGGAGVSEPTSTTGGSGGGGNGGATGPQPFTNIDGTANTGGGGGGTENSVPTTTPTIPAPYGRAGHGATGIVLIAYTPA